jgi:hypothetical protein
MSCQVHSGAAALHILQEAAVYDSDCQAPCCLDAPGNRYYLSIGVLTCYWCCAAGEHLQVLKELMDPKNCQLRAWGGVIKKNRKCPHTDLPYGDCCGSKLGAKLAKKALRQ